jgi:GT2 family glycosyltransferase
LGHIDYPSDHFEVIVVDDGGKISPETPVERARGAVRVRLLRRAHGGPAAARNAGAAAAGNPFLAFIDDDCVAASDWLTALARELSKDPTSMVGGRVVNSLGDNPFANATQCLVSYLYERHNRETPHFFCSNNLAAPRDRFMEIGGFDASFPFAAGEDRDLCDRWQLSGKPMSYAEDAIVYHAHDMGLRGFWRQHLRYGQAAAHFHRLSAARRCRSVALEPTAFYLGILRHPFREMPLKHAWTASGLLLLAQVANASGYFYERIRGRHDNHQVSFTP